MGNKTKIFAIVSFFVLVYVFYGLGDADVVLRLRIPRLFQAFFTGFALAVSGAILQSSLKNPLADPFIIGVSGGAMLFLLISKVLPFSSPVFLYFFVSAGAFAASIFAYFISKKFASSSNAGILLGGIALNSFISAVITLFVIFRKDDLLYFFHFSFGNFSGLNLSEIIISSLLALVAFFLSLLAHRSLDIISFDQQKAASLGVDVEKYRLYFFLAASVLASVSVAMSGIIGFVGLVAPNIARILSGASSLRVLIYSAFIGGFLTVFSDGLARTIISPLEIPVGVITAFIGTPFFIFLIMRGGEK